MGRKPDLREVDAVAREKAIDRDEFGDFIHELKRGGERGTKANGDFTMDELRGWADVFKRERAGDNADD